MRVGHTIYCRSGSVQKPINTRELVNTQISHLIYLLSPGKETVVKLRPGCMVRALGEWLDKSVCHSELNKDWIP